MASTLPLSNSLQSRIRLPQEVRNRNSKQILVCTSCQSRPPPMDPLGPKQKKEKDKGGRVPLLLHIFSDAHLLGMKLKDNLSPKQKGDWKDVMLMSLSFAVYVYISQQIVCAYCAWVSTIRQYW